MKNYNLFILLFICCCSSPEKKKSNDETALDTISTKLNESTKRKISISDEVYIQINQKWQQHLNVDLPLSRKILKTIEGKYHVFTVDQFWDNCSTFEYAVVLNRDSSFLATFPFSVLYSGCEVHMEFSTVKLNDSTFLQKKTFTEPLMEVDTLTHKVVDSQIREIETVKFLLTSKGLDTLDYTKKRNKN